MVTILLKCGAAVYAPRGRGTPLQLSAYVDSVKCAEALATRANLNARCERAPQSTLGIAAFESHGESRQTPT
jgi:hypothetical protein